jgi:DNA ligase-1
MLKRRDAPYVPGPPKGPWWKWKRDPFIIDAVLMYAQRGHGKRLPIRIGSRRKYRTAG